MKRAVVIASGLLLGCPAPSEGGAPLVTNGGTMGDADDDGDDDEDTDDDADDDDTPADDDDGESEGTTGDVESSGSPTTDAPVTTDSPTTGSSDSETGGETDTDNDSEPGDPNCYSEPLDAHADVAAIVSAYGGADWKDDLIAAMDARWPAGAWLLNEQRNDSYFGQFSDSNSWTGMVGWLDTLVHEETHLFNAYHAISVGESAALYFRDDLIIYMPPDESFPRAEILSELIPEAASGTYASTYLTGSQGQRGFNAVLDETACYVNEVPGLSVFGEYYGGGVSLRDGSAAFLYFIEMYLRVARTQHPDWYASAKNEQAYVDAVRILWQRTHFFYDEVADDFPNLGISDDLYRNEAYKDENLAEIEMFVGVDLDASPCYQ